MRKKIITKLYVFIFVSVICGVIVVSSLVIALLYRQEAKVDLTILEARKESRIKDIEYRINGLFGRIKSTIFTIGHDADLLDYLENPEDHQKKDHLANRFLLHLTENRLYDQIRYINEEGMEKIRVNFNDGHPGLVPDHMLQDKSDRYYFTSAAKLSQGEIYCSPLDLNIEQGVIEQPPKPMIRFATPVFSESGAKRGIIILNFLASSLIKEILYTTDNDILWETHFLNRDGYWIHAPDGKNEFAFMYPENPGTSFAESFPEIWSAVKNRERFDSKLVWLSLHISNNPMLNFIRINDDEPDLHIVLLTGKKHLAILRQNLRAKMIKISLQTLPFLVPFTLLLALFFCRSVTARRKLKTYATVDNLTGAFNRRSAYAILERQLNQSIRHRTPLTICYLDLDNLKQVNDTWGHDQGDVYIRTVFSAIKHNCRLQDSICRLGGDEFLVIFPHCDKSSARNIISRVHTTLSEYEKQAESRYRHEFSAGYCENNPANQYKSVHTMLHEADDKMYREKRTHK